MENQVGGVKVGEVLAADEFLYCMVSGMQYTICDFGRCSPSPPLGGEGRVRGRVSFIPSTHQ